MVLFLTLFSCISAAIAADMQTDTIFQRANESYSRGELNKAMEEYIHIIHNKGYSANILFNLANNYAKMGKTGKAVLNYERALRLDPNNSDIIGNLNLVQKEAGLFPHETTWGYKIINFINIDQWTILTLICLLTLITNQVLVIKKRISRRFAVGTATLSTLLLCLTVTATALSYRSFNPAVVISSGARLLVSPFASSTSTGTIQEGRLLYPEKVHGNYTYTIDQSNRRGWIHTSAIELVCIANTRINFKNN